MSDRAFDALFRAHYAALYRFAYRLLGSRADAEEVVQDVFMYVWDRKADTEDSTRVRALLYRAARNKAIDRLRSRRTRQRLLTAEALPQRESVTPANQLEHDELLRAVQRAIEALPERAGLVYTLSRKGLTYEEIAESLGISVKTVENHMARAFRLLRQNLSDYLPVTLLVLTALGK